MKLNCPICVSENTSFLHRDKYRPYIQCKNCDLVFVEQKYFETEKEEKQHYSKHENSPEDVGYRNYLTKFLDPFLNYIDKKMSGLDYGCGPGPTLSVMLEENGFHTEHYDPYFYNKTLGINSFDFISCTEVAEHFYNPMAEFKKIFSLLKPNGVLGIMTQFYTESIDFPSWYYIRDKTHVHFYSEKSLRIIAKKFNTTVSFYNNCVAIFVKN